MDKEFKKYFDAHKKAFDEMESPPENLWDGIRLQMGGEKEESDKELKNYFEENRKAFDEIEEPPVELWNKIKTEIPQYELEEGGKKQSKIRIMRYLKVAVLVALAFGLGWFLSPPSNAVVNLQKVAPEVAEAESFYLTNIVAYKKELKNYEGTNDELVKEFLTEHEQLDKLYAELKEMLLRDVDNDQILNLMIQNLQMRMTVLEKQKDILRNIQHKKTLGNDKTLL